MTAAGHPTSAAQIAVNARAGVDGRKLPLVSADDLVLARRAQLRSDIRPCDKPAQDEDNQQDHDREDHLPTDRGWAEVEGIPGQRLAQRSHVGPEDRRARTGLAHVVSTCRVFGNLTVRENVDVQSAAAAAFWNSFTERFRSCGEGSQKRRQPLRRPSAADLGRQPYGHSATPSCTPRRTVRRSGTGRHRADLRAIGEPAAGDSSGAAARAERGETVANVGLLDRDFRKEIATW